MDSECAELNAQIRLPLNVVIRIFSFISRDELENCKLVCHTWKNVIDYADNPKNTELQKRELDALILSTNQEYSISIYHGGTNRGYYFKKYFIDRDIDEIEVKRKQIHEFDVQSYRFPCGERFPNRISKRMNFLPAEPFHHEQCKILDVRPVLYRFNRNYTRKLFTPPLGFYERLARMLKKSKIKRLIFHGFTFTDLFVEKLFEYAPRESFVNVDVMVLHCCNLRCVSPRAFHALLGGVFAQHYHLSHLRNCLPDHVSAPLLDHTSIKLASTFFVGACLVRRTHTPITFPIDDEEFSNFLASLAELDKATAKGRPRSFFGIALCRVSQQFRRICERMASSKNGRSLYKHILLGDSRYLAQELLPIK